jgi:hypothetical protein
MNNTFSSSPPIPVHPLAARRLDLGLFIAHLLTGVIAGVALGIGMRLAMAAVVVSMGGVPNFTMATIGIVIIGVIFSLVLYLPWWGVTQLVQIDAHPRRRWPAALGYGALLYALITALALSSAGDFDGASLRMGLAYFFAPLGMLYALSLPPIHAWLLARILRHADREVAVGSVLLVLAGSFLVLLAIFSRASEGIRTPGHLQVWLSGMRVTYDGFSALAGTLAVVTMAVLAGVALATLWAGRRRPERAFAQFLLLTGLACLMGGETILAWLPAGMPAAIGLALLPAALLRWSGFPANRWLWGGAGLLALLLALPLVGIDRRWLFAGAEWSAWLLYAVTGLFVARELRPQALLGGGWLLFLGSWQLLWALTLLSEKWGLRGESGIGTMAQVSWYWLPLLILPLLLLLDARRTTPAVAEPALAVAHA